MQEGQVPTSAVTVVPAANASGQELFSLTDLLDHYWHVSRCWANHDLAVRENMTVEAAIQTLIRVRDQSMIHPGGARLSKMAADLLRDIVRLCEDNGEVNNSD
jgi:hypothetical protein